MTGFGKVLCVINNTNFSVEIKSLNSKQIEINLRNANFLRDLELELRKLLQQKLLRGKIDVSISEEINDKQSILNLDNIEQLYRELIDFGQNKNIPLGDIFPTVLKLSEQNKRDSFTIEDEKKEAILETLETGIDALIEFRKKEGLELEQDIVSRIKWIQKLRTNIVPFENNRIVKIRERIENELTQLKNITIDSNRLEQEIIFYAEKLDITEEHTRLQSHCTYFLEIVENNTIEKGKKLGFIAQEIGREINTIGSKANDADIQKLVVQMKDELEKIKEQLNNIL
ncbi:MAG TPA: YicC family protein [Chitinophagales bacterium]|nr:YicC family protein [Chitinophagales bacterium]MCB0511543.1 YicC family protein [Bacteroidota bacterium]MCB0513916.1 YicC family protein [Bacteroidota bacterium]HMU97470.1 YicC family protein [Chitinophagales bacterium]HMV01865.1 YicC family protein [Chitinophagales bacterium]